jgi:hypothetical protein
MASPLPICKNFRQFYLSFPDDGKSYPLRGLLTWTHGRLVMRIENPAARDFHIRETAEQGWSRRQLERAIATQAFPRLLQAPDALKGYCSPSGDRIVTGKRMTRASLRRPARLCRPSQKVRSALRDRRSWLGCPPPSRCCLASSPDGFRAKKVATTPPIALRGTCGSGLAAGTSSGTAPKGTLGPAPPARWGGCQAPQHGRRNHMKMLFCS